LERSPCFRVFKPFLLHNEELPKLYSFLNKIRMIKSRRMRWTGHVARMGRRGVHIGYWWEGQKKRDTRKTKK
jgi:hypothetical protein